MKDKLILPSTEEKVQDWDNIKEVIWVQDTTNSILNPKISQDITSDESEIVSNWIKEENKIRKHMDEKSPEQIMNLVNSWFWYIARINWEMVWCVCLTEIILSNWQKIYEAWSLISSPYKRWFWIGKILAKEVFLDTEKVIYSVTEVDSVKHIYEKILWLNKFPRDNIKDEILSMIEWVIPLLTTDEIYWNNKFLEINNK